MHVTKHPLLPATLAALLAALPACSRAEAQEAPAAKEERAAPEVSAREKVERLFPGLLSEDEAVRQRTEREIAALGEAGRAEIDRLTRDPDPQKAIAALKLLQSDVWERAAREKRGARPDARRPAFPPPPAELDEWRRDFDRQFEEMRRRMREWEEEFDPGSWMPRLEELDVPRAGTRSSGTLVENGKTFTWSVDESGRIRVTTKDGPDAKETTVESPSLDALRTDHPDLAKRLEGVLPKGGVRRWVFEWPPRAWQGGPKTGDSPSEDTGPLLRDGERRVERHDGPVEVPGPVLGIGWESVPDVLREQLDVPEGGMVVASVTPGSLAERLGLRRNDVLLRVGDRPVAGPPDVRKALEAVPEGGKLTVEILRKGRRETLASTR